MNKLKIVIVEDEKIAANNLQKLILKIDPEITVLAILSSVKQSIAWFEENDADLIFMDIQLGDGQSFKIFDNVHIKSPVIFTTAFDQYAIKAFKSNGIDYLLKPIDEGELAIAINKYKTWLSNENTDYSALKELLSHVQSKPEYKQRFIINAGSRIRSVSVDEIAYFYFTEKSVFICTYQDRKFPTEYSLDKLEEIISPDNFFRINRRILVNINAIDKMYSLSKSRIKLELKPAYEEEVLVSFNKTHLFRQWLDK